MNSFVCPHCNTLLQLAESMAAGSQVRCYQCRELMTLPAEYVPAPKPAPVIAASYGTPRPRYRRSRSKGSTNLDGNWIAIALAGGLILVGLMVLGVVLVVANADDGDDEGDDEDAQQSLVVPQAPEAGKVYFAANDNELKRLETFVS